MPSFVLTCRLALETELTDRRTDKRKLTPYYAFISDTVQRTHNNAKKTMKGKEGGREGRWMGEIKQKRQLILIIFNYAVSSAWVM